MISKSGLSIDLIEDCTNIVDILQNTDLAILEELSLLERSRLGVPSITFLVSENQKIRLIFFTKSKQQ